VIASRAPAPYLGEALASAGREGAAEVLVVDDGTGHVEEAELPSGGRLLRIPPSGRSRARTAGVRSAATPFVAFLDDDDSALAGRLAGLRAALEAEPTAPLAFGRVRVVDGGGRALDDWNELLGDRFDRLARSERRFADILACRCPIYTSATMVRRDAFLEVGGYDPAFDSYEDLDLYLRLSRLGPLAPFPGDPAADYRLHGENTQSERLYEGAVAVTEKHLGQTGGRERRFLLDWRADALWGLGRFADLRREAAASVLRDPLLLTHGAFVKRLGGSLLPMRLLESRR
jgi:glycosyltransferase involved in cell wall biosynthesis